MTSMVPSFLIRITVGSGHIIIVWQNVDLFSGSAFGRFRVFLYVAPIRFLACFILDAHTSSLFTLS
ncbi:hypothetical protein K737_300040 [Holospora undulata HU1]|uniref:Uncharacterized protein n=2 Tax=Holospora TaxID=44747 RepID=A0A061JJ15_9PROT|nr:hypothetical protein K737_300040 [Holospora undulata HU1]GAJ46817.1 hypothetical protein HE1_01159 [Holospora elegans E1]